MIFVGYDRIHIQVKNSEQNEKFRFWNGSLVDTPLSLAAFWDCLVISG